MSIEEPDTIEVEVRTINCSNCGETYAIPASRIPKSGEYYCPDCKLERDRAKTESEDR